MYLLLIFFFFFNHKIKRNPNPKSELTLIRFGSWYPTNPTSQFLLSQLPVCRPEFCSLFSQTHCTISLLSGNVRNSGSDRPLTDTDYRSFPNQNRKFCKKKEARPIPIIKEPIIIFQLHKKSLKNNHNISMERVIRDMSSRKRVLAVGGTGYLGQPMLV